MARRNQRRLRIQRLESRRVLAGHPVITEFMASNTSGLKDGFAEDSDWIEIRNDADVPVDLNGYHLTDDATDLNKWEFTESTILNPGEYLVVFATSRTVIDPAGNWHTNFQLEKDGEYLALTDPSQVVLSEYGAAGANYPRQVTNLSYGVAGAELVGPNSVVQYWIPTDDSLGNSWTSNSFDALANGFSLGRAAIGYENSPGSSTSYAGMLQTLVPSGTTNVYQRATFQVDDAASVSDLSLDLLYDDGVVVYLNGVQVVGENVPSPLGYNTPAAADHPDTQVLAGSTYNLDGQVGLLVNGQNTLAIHALNRPGSSDFLMVPRLRSQSIAGEVGHLISPTPGAANSLRLDLGPYISNVLPSTNVAQVGQALTITANVTDFTSPLDTSTVALHYVVMFGGEVTLPMTDDGLGADAVAGDSIYSAEIPASVMAAGEMIRWRVTALDMTGVETREPRFLDALDSPEYLGTVVADPAITTDLPVMQWFLENPSAASTDAGTRASLFVGGEFYDNISVNNHGQSTRGSVFPKKSFDFDANSGNKFRIRQDLKRVSDFNLLTNYADQTKLRNSLMYDLFAQGQYAHHYAFSMMVYRNGSFYGLYDVVEEGDTEYLDRLGLDPDNPLYKVNNRLDSAYTNVEKKSREYEDHSDFAEVINAAQNFSGAAALTWDFDHLDIADMVNNLAIHNVAVSSDFGHKNMYWYRDSNGTGLWSAFPWDQDLSLGHQWDASVSPPYFKDDLVTGLNIYIGYNNLFQRLFADPVFWEMYTRRLRTLADQFYGAAGTPVSESYLANNITRLEALIAEEAVADANVWGIHPNFTHTPAQAAAQLIDEFIPLRRAYLNGHPQVPPSQSANLVIEFDAVDFDADPVSGLQSEEYIRLNNPNNEAVDISGWRIDGGINHKFKGGTVIPANGTLYVVKDVNAFLNRTIGPGGGSRLLIQGNYAGQLTYTGETIDLYSADGNLVDTLETPVGTPTTNQQFLRVTEVHYNPIVDDTEFIEFANISSGGVATSLDLSGVSISAGPSAPFLFPAGTTLAPGQRLLVAEDNVALLAAYPSLSAAQIVGSYLGKLSNAGERLKVVDAGGETIFDMTYGDSDPWPMSADGAGASLVLKDPVGTPINRLAKPYSWRGSAEVGGTPGSASASLRGVVINELLTHTDDPVKDTIEIFNGSGSVIDLGGWYLSDSKSDLLKYQIPGGTILGPGEYWTVDESDFNPTPLTPAPNHFALNGSQGDEVWLVAADITRTAVVEFIDQVSIGSTFNGQSFGRIPNQFGRLVPLANNSLGGENTAHQVGEVVISEVHFHPVEPTAAELGIEPTLGSRDFEFVEINNHQVTERNLSQWRLRGAVDFDFPSGSLLGAGEVAVIVSFDPNALENANRLLAFQTHFGIDSSVTLLGPFSQSLGNSYGRVELEQPDDAPVDEPTVMPSVMLDEVFYDDLLPWPVEADGAGDSLQRVSESSYGNAAESWVAADPTPGLTRYLPHVLGIQVNAGSSQRSAVTSVTVSFDRPIDVAADSFELRRRDDGAVISGLIVDTATGLGPSVARITFGGGSLVQTGAAGNTLVDGNYELLMRASETISLIGGAAMQADATFGTLARDRFFRQYGDSDGDRDVDSQDFGLFGLSFLKSAGVPGFNASFDVDGDGDVDGLDYGRFVRRLGKRMEF